MLDLSKDVKLWYRKLYICRDATLFYEHKIPLVRMNVVKQMDQDQADC